ncbi:MAG: LPS export ABC transporter periplasmic protein LptC [Rhodoferax sp.]
MKSLLAALWERFLLALPMALMLALALGSYWLVRTTPPPVEPAPASSAAHAPDYFMEQFSMKNFDSLGRLHAEVRGSAARHFPDTRWIEMDAIAVRSVDDKGRLIQAWAQRGLSNDEVSEVQLIGQARIVREAQNTVGRVISPELEFTGAFLDFFVKEETVKSHLPVVLRHGAHQFSADTLHFDNAAQVLTLTGRVHATFVPAPQK